LNRVTPMEVALEQARLAAARCEVPVGAVVVATDGSVVSRAGNMVEASNDASAHAELLALRGAAAARGAKWLTDCDLVVTLEPCPMCAHAISLFRIRRLVFGAYDPKSGGVEHGARVFDAASCHHRPEVVGGVREAEAAALLRGFFGDRLACGMRFAFPPYAARQSAFVAVGCGASLARISHTFAGAGSVLAVPKGFAPYQYAQYWRRCESPLARQLPSPSSRNSVRNAG
jgi:tRNA(adenine34) deaminase